jgi:hypothetical protein
MRKELLLPFLFVCFVSCDDRSNGQKDVEMDDDFHAKELDSKSIMTVAITASPNRPILYEIISPERENILVSGDVSDGEKLISMALGSLEGATIFVRPNSETLFGDVLIRKELKFEVESVFRVDVPTNDVLLLLINPSKLTEDFGDIRLAGRINNENLGSERSVVFQDKDGVLQAVLKNAGTGKFNMSFFDVDNLDVEIPGSKVFSLNSSDQTVKIY